ncbi:MAG: hypothetical protein BWY59_02016 [Verrucomicrobia bacterium ADurb.Bin345]|nr:MAG: hypothetical protein BWY59_02016 [Verrucomicrobia bacterium ADurb.Bin345]
MMRSNDYLMTNGRFPRLRGTAATPRLEELIRIVTDWQD